MHILNHVIWEIRLGQEIRKHVYMHCNNLVSGYRKTSHFNLFGQRWAYFKWIGEIWLRRLKNFNQAASERKVSVVRHKQFFFSPYCVHVFESYKKQTVECWELTCLFLLISVSVYVGGIYYSKSNVLFFSSLCTAVTTIFPLSEV